jgi:hypothetical protein
MLNSSRNGSIPVKLGILLIAGLCLALVSVGCGGSAPKGRTGKWKFSDTDYEYTPDKLPGTWSNGTKTVQFKKDGTVSWDSESGKYQFASDGALLVQMEAPGHNSNSYKYTVIDNKLILLSNWTGTLDEYKKVDSK